MKKLIFILLLLGVVVVPGVYFAVNGIHGKPREWTPVPEARKPGLEAFVADLMSDLADGNARVLDRRINRNATIKEFRRSTGERDRISNPSAISEMLRDTLLEYAEEFDLSTARLHRARQSGSTVDALLWLEYPYAAGGDYLKLELKEDNGGYEVFDVGYGGYGPDFCDTIYLEGGLNLVGRLVDRYSEVTDNYTGDSRQLLEGLNGIPVEALPKGYRIKAELERAFAHNELTNHLEAARSYRAVRELDPDQWMTRLLEAQLLQEMERHDQVEPMLTPYFEAVGRDTLGLPVLAESYLALGRTNDARAVHKELMEQDPDGDAMFDYLTSFGPGEEAALREELASLLPDRHDEIRNMFRWRGESHHRHALAAALRASDPEHPDLHYIAAVEAEENSNYVGAAEHYLAGYGKADESNQYRFVSGHLWALVAAEDDPLAALRASPDTEAAYYELHDEYSYETNVWPGIVDYVANKDPDRYYALNAQAGQAEEEDRWKDAVALHRRAYDSAHNEDLDIDLESGIARSRAMLGESVEAYDEAENKLRAYHAIRNQLWWEDRTEEFDRFLTATLGSKGLDRNRPVTDNTDLLGEDGLDGSDLCRVWSDLRFLQERYDDSRALAERVDGADHWRHGRVMACLIKAGNYRDAEVYVSRFPDVHPSHHVHLLAKQGKVEDVVRIIEEARGEGRGDWAFWNEDLLEVLRAPEMSAALEEIDFEYPDADE